MAVRNSAELGVNLQKIVTRLMANDTLINLLYYMDKDPLSQPHLTEEEKKKFIFQKLIKIVPRVGPKETAASLISIRVDRATQIANKEFKNIKICVEVFVPLEQWIIKDNNLRPFLILGEVEKSLNNKTINGLGKMQGGNFTLNFLTEEISCYAQDFEITTYD